MWSFKNAKEKKAEKAAPEPDDNAFVVPDYTHGSPYVQANYVYADNPEIDDNHFPYRTVTWQQKHLDKETYPEAGKPPGRWLGYRRDSWRRSQRDEIVINAEEGFPLRQQFHRMALNPYFQRNVVNRPQVTPHEYSFVRPFDKDVLGKRDLNGMHYSQATIGQSSEPLKGMKPPAQRRSTYRVEPIQFTVATIDDADTGSVGAAMTFTSPDSVYPDRSYRLT